MVRESGSTEGGEKPSTPKADDQSHKPAAHIEETARLASAVEKTKDPGKVRAAND
jgi:hypothetical protein